MNGLSFCRPVTRMVSFGAVLVGVVFCTAVIGVGTTDGATTVGEALFLHHILGSARVSGTGQFNKGRVYDYDNLLAAGIHAPRFVQSRQVGRSEYSGAFGNIVVLLYENKTAEVVFRDGKKASLSFGIRDGEYHAPGSSNETGFHRITLYPNGYFFFYEEMIMKIPPMPGFEPPRPVEWDGYYAEYESPYDGDDYYLFLGNNARYGYGHFTNSKTLKTDFGTFYLK